MKGSQAGLSQELLCRTCVSCSMSWESSSLIKWRCAGQGHQAAHPAPPATFWAVLTPSKMFCLWLLIFTGIT